MRVGLFVLFTAFGVMSATPARAALPQCNDGIDNDGDGQIDFAGDPNGLYPPDTDCRSATWNSEASGSDMGYHPFDGGAGTTDAATGINDSGIPPGEGAHDGSDPFEHPDGNGGSSGAPTTAGGGSTDGDLEPPRHGCDMGGNADTTLPLLVIVAAGAGLALVSRRTRT